MPNGLRCLLLKVSDIVPFSKRVIRKIKRTLHI